MLAGTFDIITSLIYNQITVEAGTNPVSGYTYAVLNDAEVEADKTRIELSLNPNFNINTISYPLAFTIGAGDELSIYIRLIPSFNTGDKRNIQVRCTGVPTVGA